MFTFSQSSDKLKLDNFNEIIPDKKNQDCEMIVVPIATLMDLDHAQPLAETNYSAVSHSGNDFGQLDGIQVAAGCRGTKAAAAAVAGPAARNNNYNTPSTPLRIEAAPAVTSTTSSAARAAAAPNPNDMDSSHGGRVAAASAGGHHDGGDDVVAAAAGQLDLDSNKPKQPFSTTVITSNTFSSKRFDDSNKMNKNKISNYMMNLTTSIIDYDDYNFNYYPMTTSLNTTTTLIKPSDDDNDNEITDDVIDYSENDDPKMTSMNYYFSKMSTAAGNAKKPNRRPSIVDYSTSDNDKKEFKRQLMFVVQDDDQIANAAGDLTSTCLKVCCTTYLYNFLIFLPSLRCLTSGQTASTKEPKL